jgi:hypothetical protein
MRVLVEYRFVISLALSAVAGVGGLHAWPFPHENLVLGLIEVSRPMVYTSFCYAYATVWFSTPFFLFNIVFSLAYIFVARTDRQTRSAPLRPYPASASRARPVSRARRTALPRLPSAGTAAALADRP